MDASISDYGTFMRNHAACFQGECPKLWVFGYGSLLWKTDFEYNSYRVGYVENYQRRFNQGNETFRGTKGKPARVANLEESQGGKVWGLAYEICGKEEVKEVLRKLYVREIACGGYKVTMTTFHPRKNDSPVDTTKCCSGNLRNIPLPHPPCGLSKCHQAQINNCHFVDSSQLKQQQSPTSLSDSSSLQHLFAPEISSPCSVQSKTIRKSKNTEEDLLQTDGSERLSYITSNKDNIPSENKENKWSTRKPSVDSVNHSKLNQIYSQQSNSNISKEIQKRTIGSRENTADQNPTLSRSTTNSRRPLGELGTNFTTPYSQESPIKVLLFTVTHNNSLYLGPDDVDKMAAQIVQARGSAGTNVEYVLRISEFIKKFIPEDDDTHLFQLDDLIREELRVAAEKDKETNTTTTKQEENAACLRIIS